MMKVLCGDGGSTGRMGRAVSDAGEAVCGLGFGQETGTFVRVWDGRSAASGAIYKAGA